LPLPEPLRPRDRLVVMFAFDGGNLIDVAGPLQAFNTAAWVRPPGTPGYQLLTVSERGGPVVTAPGLALLTEPLSALTGKAIDTLIVPGGLPPEGPVHLGGLVAWLRRNATRPRRLCSVCTGAYLLADAGLLDGRRCTTHWSRADELERRRPAIRMDSDSIFVRDGNIWTSGGVTAGIDLALALIEEDHGAAIAQALAREFVLYARRSGGQAQFTPALRAQETAPGKIKALQEWILAHLEEDLAVEVLAARSAMSPRHFARRFREEAGMTPAAFVAAARLDAARQALAIGADSIDRVAHRFGFGTAERLRRTFQRHLAVTPTQFREHFQIANAAQ